MRKNLIALLVLLAVNLFSVAAAGIVLDGKLDEPQWSSAEEHADFQQFKGGNQDLIMPKTSFRLVFDEHNLYLGIYCKEPKMEQLKAPAQKYPWGCDLVEIFMSPAGRQDEFYQFVISAGNIRWCEFYGEGGNIRPDPGFAPIWESSVFKGADFWSLEIRIPLSGFYHTRNTQWQKEWLFNITRDRTVDKSNSATWSPLVNRNQESSLFRRLGGFPERQAEDDLFIESATANIEALDKSGCSGTLKFRIFSAVAGERKLSFNGAAHSVKLTNGKNEFELPCHFEMSQGRQYIQFNIDSENNVGRTFPVLLKYEPVQITLKTPGYSNTFYPGQEKSKVIGTVKLKSAEKVTVTFEGEGIAKQSRTFSNGKQQYDFAFDSSKIGASGAKLTAQTASAKVELKVNAPAPIKNRMVWIENGYLVIDGKPIFVRMIEGIGFGTGTRFNKFFDGERDSFKINNEIVKRVVLEPFRLVKGIEKEAILDQEPSQVLLDAIKNVIEKNRNQDFCYYFLTDEPECRNISSVYLEHLYHYVKSLDLFHPVMICSREPERFVNCADYITMHPYWNPYFDGHGKRLLTRQLDTIPNFFKGWQAYNKASALVPQVFSYRNFANRVSDYPTLDEMESACWASIACGATGIEAYHYHDFGDRAVLYEGMRYIMPSLERLDCFLLTPDKKSLPSVDKTMTSLFTAGKDKLLILVNLSDKEVEMKAPCRKMVEFCGKRLFNGRMKLGAYQTALFTSRKMDEGLPSRDEVRALIAKKEQERLGTKNIFLERGFDITLSESWHNNYGSHDWVLSKMFDGNFMIQAWEMPGWKDAWIELGFPKFTPEFTRLILHGNNLERVKVKYWKDGEWRELTQKAVVEYSEYKAEYKCSERIRTVKLRMEVAKKGDKSCEIYELEAYNDGAAAASEAQVSEQAAAVQAKDNVLWQQTGKNIVLDRYKGWDVERIKVFANEEGKLTILGDIKDKKTSPATAINFPLDKAYPWLVFRLNRATNNNSTTYHAWYIIGPAIGSFVQDISPIPGIYVINLNELPKWPGNKSYFAIYAYSEELVFDEISIVKQMECMLSSKLKADGIEVTAQLAAPAESVSVRVCHKSCNLTGEFNLKPVDEKRMQWAGTFAFEKPLQHGKVSVFKAGELDLRADILGGGISVPVFKKMYQAYP